MKTRWNILTTHPHRPNSPHTATKIMSTSFWFPSDILYFSLLNLRFTHEIWNILKNYFFQSRERLLRGEVRTVCKRCKKYTYWKNLFLTDQEGAEGAGKVKGKWAVCGSKTFTLDDAASCACCNHFHRCEGDVVCVWVQSAVTLHCGPSHAWNVSNRVIWKYSINL